MLRRVHDPGLPSWPALYVDQSQRAAYVTMRVVNWRSVERASVLSAFLVLAISGAAIGLAWLLIPAYEDSIFRGVMVLIVAGAMFTIVGPLLRSALPPFVSRLVFARRLTIFCTPEYFAFRSCHYANGVRVSRSFDGFPLSLRLMVEDDREAQAYVDELPRPTPGEPAESRQHFTHSASLVLMIRSAGEPDRADEISARQRFRTIPIASMDAKIAERFVVLMNAAMDMTRIERTYHPANVAGHDLDLPPNIRR